MDAATELDAVHGDGYESQAGIVKARRNPRDFIDPAQEMATEEKPEVIEMLRKNEFVILHLPARVAR